MKVVVFGATGVVGHAAAEYFAGLPGTTVLGVARRPPSLRHVEHIPLDLLDRAACEREMSGVRFRDCTHVVYAALKEGDELVAGWRDRDVMGRNALMFRNALEPLVRASGSSLHHVTLLQGAKAYGFHVGRTPLPAKERGERDRHDNFYFLQEDALLEMAARAGFAWTILRPQVVYGLSIGSPMNLLPAIGVYASIERAHGRPLSFPGGSPAVQEAVDAHLLARAIGWAATDVNAHGQTFNITNGDVFSWHDVWPAIASAFGMEVGDPTPVALAASMPARAGEWASLVDRHHLRAPRDMDAFVGRSWAYADLLFGTNGGRGTPALLSTVKIRQAGFRDCVDTDDMFREWFSVLQQRRFLPAPT